MTHCTIWTKEDNLKLAQLRRAGVSAVNIAEKMGRTATAIKARLAEKSQMKTRAEFRGLWYACAKRNGYPTAGIML